MKKERNCSNCKHTNKIEDEFPCSVCSHRYIDKYEPATKTNYDRIKSMSVEEIAQELTKAEAEGYESAMPMIYSAWKQWLLQEVSEDE